MVRGRVVKGLGAREKLRARAREKLRARAMEKLFRGKKGYGANCERENGLWTK